LKELVVRHVRRTARRVSDDTNSKRIKAALVWRTRQLKTGRTHVHKKMSDWPKLSPSPVRAPKRSSPTSVRSSS
jgi:hypothetical protein